jgi:hypothetical protein
MHGPYEECIRVCNQCAVTCEHCASECIHEHEVNKLSRCIELDLVCAQMCRTAAIFMSKSSELSDRVCILCSQVCHLCGDECAKHVQMEHCKECSETCYQCAKVCRDMASIHV